MKIQSILTATALLTSSVAAFAPTAMKRPVAMTTQLDMFGGAGEGAPLEDDPETEAKIAEAAKAMNMSVDEYKMGLQARVRFEKELTETRCTAGNEDKVSVTRDAHNPPRMLEVTITDAGKAMGKDAVAKELVKAVKKAADDSKMKRAQAQKNMMTWIAETMKQ